MAGPVWSELLLFSGKLALLGLTVLLAPASVEEQTKISLSPPPLFVSPSPTESADLSESNNFSLLPALISLFDVV